MEGYLKINEIEKYLNSEYMGRKIVYKDITESTNDDAKISAENNEREGAVFIAETQKRGRGRMLREWKTDPKDSIAMTILLRPEIKPSEAPTITPILALSTVEALKGITSEEIKIKWPNDVFLGNKKLGGILTEMKADMDGVKYILVGMGLNINQETLHEEIANIATSLKIYTGKEFGREIIIAEILNRFEINYEYFRKYGLSFFGKVLKEHSSVIGKEVIVVSGLEMIEGVAEDLDETGNLLLRLEDGRLKTIIYGDVSLKCKELLKD